MCQCIQGQIRGGGGGVTRHMTGNAPMSKNSVERVCFSDIQRHQSFPYGCFFILHRTLGVPHNKLLETLIQNAMLGYLSQHYMYNNSKMRHLGLFLAGLTPFRGANVTWCDTSFRVNFRGWWTRVGSQLVCGGGGGGGRSRIFKRGGAKDYGTHQDHKERSPLRPGSMEVLLF